MPFVKFFSVLLMFLFLVSQSSVVMVFAETGESVAASALADAEGVVALAYQAMLSAERAGVNVSSLLIRLNEAGQFLVQGHDAYRVGDFDGAVLLPT